MHQTKPFWDNLYGDVPRGWGHSSWMGTFLFHGHRPLAFGAPFGLTSCQEKSWRGVFFLFSHHRERLSKHFWGTEGEVFLQVIRLQGFSWYDFVSFDNSSSAKLGHSTQSIRQKKVHVFATSRYEALRVLLWRIFLPHCSNLAVHEN